MSSKLILPEDDGAASRLIWRQVRTEGPKPTEEMQEDFRAQMARMREQCEERIREAHAEGVREGEATGRTQASADLQPVIERLSGAIDDLAALRPRLRREAEADMVKLALAIARRVLRRELSMDPEALHGLVLAALEKLQGQELCRVKVHPSHAAAIGAYLANAPGGQRVEVVAVATEPGTAVFETARGNLDASVESQLHEIERGLADQLKRHS